MVPNKAVSSRLLASALLLNHTLSVRDTHDYARQGRSPAIILAGYNRDIVPDMKYRGNQPPEGGRRKTKDYSSESSSESSSSSPRSRAIIASILSNLFLSSSFSALRAEVFGEADAWYPAV